MDCRIALNSLHLVEIFPGFDKNAILMASSGRKLCIKEMVLNFDFTIMIQDNIQDDIQDEFLVYIQDDTQN